MPAADQDFCLFVGRECLKVENPELAGVPQGKGEMFRTRGITKGGSAGMCWGAAGTRISESKALGQEGLQSACGIQVSEQFAWFGEQPYMFNALPHSLCSPEDAAPTQEYNGSYSPAKGWIPLNTSPLT